MPYTEPTSIVDIERLFLRLSARYQRLWTALFPTPEAYAVAVNEWALILEGIDVAGIERALRRCLTEFPTYPPKPAEFRALTQPRAQELGLPTLDVAYRAALERRWRYHPLVWHIVSTIGQYEFIRMPEGQVSQRFREIYEQLVEQVAKARQIDPNFQLRFPEAKVSQLTQDKPARVTAPGDARAHIATIRKRLAQGR